MNEMHQNKSIGNIYNYPCCSMNADGDGGTETIVNGIWYSPKSICVSETRKWLTMTQPTMMHVLCMWKLDECYFMWFEIHVNISFCDSKLYRTQE